MLNNETFISVVENAIEFHVNWMATIKELIEGREIIPLEVDCNKCAFGQFYNSLKPTEESIIPIWNEMTNQHSAFNKKGFEITDAIKKQDYGVANSEYMEAEILSQDLITVFENLLKTAKELTESDKNIF